MLRIEKSHLVYRIYHYRLDNVSIVKKPLYSNPLVYATFKRLIVASISKLIVKS